MNPLPAFKVRVSLYRSSCPQTHDCLVPAFKFEPLNTNLDFRLTWLMWPPPVTETSLTKVMGLPSHPHRRPTHLLNWHTYPRPTPPHPACLHTQDDKTMFFTCSRHRQSQSRELMQIDARTWLQAPNAEKSPRVGTLTPADGIQVPQSAAATRGPGQRAVPPGDWPGSVLEGG